jgi:hypothetical protein
MNCLTDNNFKTSRWNLRILLVFGTVKHLEVKKVENASVIKIVMSTKSHIA